MKVSRPDNFYGQQDLFGPVDEERRCPKESRLCYNPAVTGPGIYMAAKPVEALAS